MDCDAGRIDKFDKKHPTSMTSFPTTQRHNTQIIKIVKLLYNSINELIIVNRINVHDINNNKISLCKNVWVYVHRLWRDEYI